MKGGRNCAYGKVEIPMVVNEQCGCAKGLFYNQKTGECLSVCSAGDIGNPDDHLCETCHDSCKTCNGPTFKDCLSCKSTAPILLRGKCLKKCPAGSYQDGFTCKRCHLSCATCSAGGDNKCLTCKNPDHTLKDGKCEAIKPAECPLG